MSCENCQELIHDLVDGTISGADELNLNAHLKDCLDCDSVRQDLESIVSFCRTHRGQYVATPNERALWLRIRNTLEAGRVNDVASDKVAARRPFLSGLMGRSWELSFSQMAASVSAIVLLVSVATVVGVRRWEGSPPSAPPQVEASNVNDRTWQQQQVINYWNQRVEPNKARWNPAMRETFDRNLKVIDQAVSETMNELHRNPHDEISEQMLNDALNDKLALLKEFSDL
jgi:anti-sigma factor RsiW